MKALKYQANEDGSITCLRHGINFPEGHDCPICIEPGGGHDELSYADKDSEPEHEWSRLSFDLQDAALREKEKKYSHSKSTAAAARPTDKPQHASDQQVGAEQPFVVRWRLAFLHAAPLPYGKRLKANPDLKERSLPEGVRYVLLVLSTFMDQNGYCWPSQCAIAERAGRSERSVGANLRHAVEHKWLRATARKTARLKPGRPALAYQALIPEQAIRAIQAEVRP